MGLPQPHDASSRVLAPARACAVFRARSVMRAASTFSASNQPSQPTMSSRRYSRRTRRVAPSSASPPAMRLTRSRMQELGPGADLLGRPIMCPIQFCNTLIHPSFAPDGTVEYRCYVGRHGRIGQVVNGRIELTVRTIVSPQALLAPSRPRCCVLGCGLVSNATCGRDSCLQHCLQNEGSCGGYAHDYARANDNMLGVRRLEGVEPRPRTPLFLPSLTPEPSRTPPSSPIPGVDYDPELAYVQLVFIDRDLTVEAVCSVEFDTVDLMQQSVRIRDTLHVHQIRPCSLEYLDADGEWYPTAGRSIPPRYGQLYLRARSVGHARNFPPAHFVDMAPRVDRFFKLLDRNVAPDRAFETVFACTAMPADHESLELCRQVLQQSPKHLRESFTAAGRTPQGTWADFVHCCANTQGELPSTPRSSGPPSAGASSSPTFARGRATWRGPPSSEAGPSRRFSQNASPPPMIIDSDSD